MHLLWLIPLFALGKAWIKFVDFLKTKKAILQEYKPSPQSFSVTYILATNMHKDDFVLSAERQNEIKEANDRYRKYFELANVKKNEALAVRREIQEINNTPDVRRNQDGQISRHSYHGQALRDQIDTKDAELKKIELEIYPLEYEHQVAFRKAQTLRDQPKRDLEEYTAKRKSVYSLAAIFLISLVITQILAPLQDIDSIWTTTSREESSSFRFEPDQDLQVSVDVLVLREGANRNSRALANLPKGVIVKLIELSESEETIDNITASWAKVRLKSGKTGFVFSGFLRPTK